MSDFRFHRDGRVTYIGQHHRVAAGTHIGRVTHWPGSDSYWTGTLPDDTLLRDSPGGRLTKRAYRVDIAQSLFARAIIQAVLDARET